MTRLIDADAVYKWYLEAFKGQIKPNEIRFSMNDIRDNLENISTIDAEPQWIPVSERLPKESDIYLVTLKTDGIPCFEIEFPNGFVYVSAYDAAIMNWGYGGKNVIAWMPLPKPYEVKE